MSKTATIHIQDFVNCVVSGLHPDHQTVLFEKLGVFATNHRFQPKFQLGQWDGKIRYFHKTGKTFVNLLDRVIPELVKWGYSIEIDDKRPDLIATPSLITKDFFSHIGNDDGEPWEVRPYQIELVNKLISNSGGIGLAGTGAGKSSCCAAIALAYEKSDNYRSIIIVPDKYLNNQTTKDYQFFGVDVGQYFGDKKDLSHQHVVSTWQSLKNVPNLIQEFQVVIVDECHGIKGPVLQSILNEYGKNVPYRFGVTGTIPKEDVDRMAIETAVGTVQIEIPAHELIDQGYLSKIDIDVFYLETDLHEDYQEFKQENPDISPMPSYTKFKNSYFPDWASEKRYIQTEKNRLAWMSNHLTGLSLQEKGNVLCLVSGVQFGKKLSSVTPGSQFLYGKDEVEVREKVYNLFSTNDNLIVIANAQIASTGLNIKRIFNLVTIDLGKSFTRVIQSIGRGLRKAKDKDSVHMSDIGSDLKYSKRHMAQRIKYYDEAKYPHKKNKVKITKR